MKNKLFSEKDNTAQAKITLRQKAVLVIFGIFLCAVLLETGLRLGGFIFLSLQEYRNRISLLQKGTYHIICLGESTTAMRGGHSYPSQLEEILNKRDIGIKFSVVNKGVPGTDTATIASLTEGYLDRYKPDMVVAMIGINDMGEKIKVRYDEVPAGKPVLFFRALRVTKLFRLIRLHLFNKMKEMDNARAEGEEKGNVLPVKVFSYAESGESAEYVRLGCGYRMKGEYDKAEKIFQKAIETDRKNYNAYIELAWNYIFGQKGTDPRIIEELFKKSIEINPVNCDAYIGLGRFYTYQGNSGMAGKMFKKAIKAGPENETAYIELGELYGSKKEYRKAVEMLAKALGLNSKNDRVCRRLAFYYNKLGEYGNAEEINNKADKIILEYYDSALCYNYKKIKEIVTDRKVKLVCVQYPMRSIEPLKRIFQDEGDIIFVDNEKVFKEAVKKDGYNEYFDDMFGGDFGHCAIKGNRLLAENIATVISKECFSPLSRPYLKERDIAAGE